MAAAKKCDRCGAFYENNTLFPRTAGAYETVVDGVCYTTKSGFHTNRKDLCDDCLRKLHWFLGGMELKEV
jgi:hypothetical protein